VHASVGSINEADSNLRSVLEEQTAELDEIALRASNVAGQVAGALPWGMWIKPDNRCSAPPKS